MTDAKTKCQWCGGVHGGHCPEVKALEFFENGTLKRVEFVTRGDQRPSEHHHHHAAPLPRELTDAEKERIAREHMLRIRM